MTTVVFKDNTFAWDEQVTQGNSFYVGESKVFKRGDQVWFGYSGSVKVANTIKYMSLPELPGVSRKERTPEIMRRWIVTSLVPNIGEALEKSGALEIQNGIHSVHSRMIVSVCGVTCYLGSDLAMVEDSSGIFGVGSGANFALGALHAGASPLEAVQIASRLDIYTGGEIKTLTID